MNSSHEGLSCGKETDGRGIKMQGIDTNNPKRKWLVSLVAAMGEEIQMAVYICINN
jgi:hypothetical protein